MGTKFTMEEKRVYYTYKVNELQDKLKYYKTLLQKATPIEPIVDNDRHWNPKTKKLEDSPKYYCGYCGEPLVKIGAKKHRCGYYIDWGGVKKTD